MGTPEFAVSVLAQLCGHHEVVAVYTQPDRLAGRGRAPTTSPVKKVAEERGLTVVQPQSLKEGEERARLSGFAPEVIVVAAYGLLLPSWVLHLPPLGCVNVHPSILPRHRGASPVAGAILAGDEATGVTIMLLDEGLDTGPILAQASLPIQPSDTTGTLTGRLAELGARLLIETLPCWQGGEVRAVPQDDSLATYTRPLKKDAGEIDWGLPAVVIERRVRAFQPWPGCYTWWGGRRLKVLEARVVGEVQGLAGMVRAQGQGVWVETGQGWLELRRVQLEGRQALAIQEFIRGQRGFIGAILPQNAL